MKPKTFDKIQELIQAINATKRAGYSTNNPVEMRVYHAVHDLKIHAEKESKRILLFK